MKDAWCVSVTRLNFSYIANYSNFQNLVSSNFGFLISKRQRHFKKTRLITLDPWIRFQYDNIQRPSDDGYSAFLNMMIWIIFWIRLKSWWVWFGCHKIYDVHFWVIVLKSRVLWSEGRLMVDKSWLFWSGGRPMVYQKTMAQMFRNPAFGLKYRSKSITNFGLVWFCKNHGPGLVGDQKGPWSRIVLKGYSLNLCFFDSQVKNLMR
jgi:hypothetical protein